MRARLAATFLFLLASRVSGSPKDFGVPQPHGWIGTTNQWIQGAGIVFAVFNLVLMFKETPDVFTAFMVLGPLLFLMAFLLLSWVNFQELRAKKVL